MQRAGGAGCAIAVERVGILAHQKDPTTHFLGPENQPFKVCDQDSRCDDKRCAFRTQGLHQADPVGAFSDDAAFAAAFEQSDDSSAIQLLMIRNDNLIHGPGLAGAHATLVGKPARSAMILPPILHGKWPRHAQSSKPAKK